VKTNGRKGRRVRPYTTGEAAVELGLSQRKVIRLCDAGILEHFWTPGHGQRRIPVSALNRYREQET
jgi:excisionase family DNA binding protein